MVLVSSLDAALLTFSLLALMSLATIVAGPVRSLRRESAQRFQDAIDGFQDSLVDASLRRKADEERVQLRRVGASADDGQVSGSPQAGPERTGASLPHATGNLERMVHDAGVGKTSAYPARPEYVQTIGLLTDGRVLPVASGFPVPVFDYLNPSSPEPFWGQVCFSAHARQADTATDADITNAFFVALLHLSRSEAGRAKVRELLASEGLVETAP